MVWDLLQSGLNVGGALASVGSLVSGFSLEKNIRQIESSIQQLHNLYSELQNDSHIRSIARNEVTHLISNFSSSQTPDRQLYQCKELELLCDELKKEIDTRTNNILNKTLYEMKNILESSIYSRGNPQILNTNIYRELIDNPYKAGITKCWDISDGGLWARSDRKIVNPNTAPITWGNPITGQMFMGEMAITRLHQHGINITVPQYTYTVKGHVFSERHGLYVPSYLI